MTEAAIVLMPKQEPGTETRFEKRYSGLEHEIGALGLIAAFAHSHDSYDMSTHGFSEYTTSRLEPVAGIAPEQVIVVRDLTMPKTHEKSLYEDPDGPIV